MDLDVLSQILFDFVLYSPDNLSQRLILHPTTPPPVTIDNDGPSTSDTPDGPSSQGPGPGPDSSGPISPDPSSKTSEIAQKISTDLAHCLHLVEVG